MASTDPKELTRDDLANYFHLPIAEVASRLGVCATVFKKLCRKNDIPRWPYRKLQCLDKLISSLENTAPRNETDAARIAQELDCLRNKRAFIVQNPRVLTISKSKADSLLELGNKEPRAVAPNDTKEPRNARTAGTAVERGPARGRTGAQNRAQTRANFLQLQQAVQKPRHRSVATCLQEQPELLERLHQHLARAYSVFATEPSSSPLELSPSLEHVGISTSDCILPTMTTTTTTTATRNSDPDLEPNAASQDTLESDQRPIPTPPSLPPQDPSSEVQQRSVVEKATDEAQSTTSSFPCEANPEAESDIADEGHEATTRIDLGNPFGRRLGGPGAVTVIPSSQRQVMVESYYSESLDPERCLGALSSRVSAFQSYRPPNCI